MLQAWMDGEAEPRPPRVKGERAVCRDCNCDLFAVLPIENAWHWRHRGGDCDSWSEPETPWHAGWKAKFDVLQREVTLRDEVSREFHRADVLCRQPSGRAVVLELQHSSIAEEERLAREAFYGRDHTMYWLLHIYDDAKNFRAWSLSISLDFNNPVDFGGHRFGRMKWFGRSKQFIERWKRSGAHVFLHAGERIFYLATMAACAPLVTAQKRGEFALCELSEEQFVAAVKG